MKESVTLCRLVDLNVETEMIEEKSYFKISNIFSNFYLIIVLQTHISFSKMSWPCISACGRDALNTIVDIKKLDLKTASYLVAYDKNMKNGLIVQKVNYGYVLHTFYIPLQYNRPASTHQIYPLTSSPVTSCNP